MLKAKAWLDLTARVREGEKVDRKHIRKHRNDVFRLALLLPAGHQHAIPHSVYEDLCEFLAAFPADSSDWASIRAAVGKRPALPPVEDVIASLSRAFVVVQ